MMELNLFGELQDEPKPKHRPGKFQSFKVLNKYRPCENKAARCKNCKNSVYLNHHDKHYYKCELMGISMSEASDIRANHVCELFQKENPRP